MGTRLLITVLIVAGLFLALLRWVELAKMAHWSVEWDGDAPYPIF